MAWECLLAYAHCVGCDEKLQYARGMNLRRNHFIIDSAQGFWIGGYACEERCGRRARNENATLWDQDQLPPWSPGRSFAAS